MGSPKNAKLSQLNKKSVLQKLAAAALLFAAAAGLTLLCAEFSREVEPVYRAFSRGVMYWLSRVTGFVPFSVAELLLYCAAALALALAARFVFVMVRGGRRGAYAAGFFANAALIASAAALFFQLAWGINYGMPPLASALGYEAGKGTDSELAELCAYLVEQTNARADRVERSGGALFDGRSVTEIARDTAKAVSAYTKRHEVPAKYALFSEGLSHLNITGVFVPFTGEANINRHMKTISLPYTMAHEMSHRYGVAREDEANFLAFYILKDSGDALLSYSAFHYALIYAQNELYEHDEGKYRELRALYNDNVNRDLEDKREYWRQYEGAPEAVATFVNDTYLTIQGQSEGVKSYGRMVDLLLAWYKKDVRQNPA